MTETKTTATKAVHNRPLAIYPERLPEYAELKIEAASWREEMLAEAREKKLYRLEGDTAVLSISGFIASKVTIWAALGYEIATEQIEKNLQALLARDDVKRIILEVDSPGGEVDGIEPLSNVIFEARAKKEILALASPMAASAAYWLASSASQVFLASKTAVVGSVGVVMMHRDWSKLEEKFGIKTTEIYAGKYKRIASPYKPLSQEGEAYLKSQVDYMYSIFVEAEARNRGKSIEEVLAWESRLFIGSQAIDAGLADGITTLGKLLLSTRDSPAANTAFAHGGPIPTPLLSQESVLPKSSVTSFCSQIDPKKMKEFLTSSEAQKAISDVIRRDPAGVKTVLKGAEMPFDPKTITEAYLAENCPQLLASLKASAKEEGREEGHKQGFEEGKKVGADTERARIARIQKLTIEGFEAVATKAIDNGDSPQAFTEAQTEEAIARGGMTLPAIKAGSQSVPASPNATDDETAADAAEEKLLVEAAAAAANQGKQT